MEELVEGSTECNPWGGNMAFLQMYSSKVQRGMLEWKCTNLLLAQVYIVESVNFHVRMRQSFVLYRPLIMRHKVAQVMYMPCTG